MGNVVVWKPSDTQVYSAQVIMEIFQEGSLPMASSTWSHATVLWQATGLKHREFAGLHFFGSTGVFRHLKTIGENLEMYRSYAHCG